jgi:hypothetical protein
LLRCNWIGANLFCEWQLVGVSHPSLQCVIPGTLDPEPTFRELTLAAADSSAGRRCGSRCCARKFAVCVVRPRVPIRLGRGDKRGLYAPDGWKLKAGHYGMLKTWRVTPEETFVDGVKISVVSLRDLDLASHHSFG